MGMFDYVDYPETPCLVCGEMVSNWQSKSGNCELQLLKPAELVAQTDLDEQAVFYGYCNSDDWNNRSKQHHCNYYKVLPPKEVEVVSMGADDD